MPEFRTRFSPTMKNDHVYDRSDNVDRLTYVDPVLQIQQMQRMGVNYALRKGQTIVDDAFDPLLDEYKFSTPVYAQDLVDTDRMIAMYKKARTSIGNSIEKQKYIESQKALESEKLSKTAEKAPVDGSSIKTE